MFKFGDPVRIKPGVNVWPSFIGMVGRVKYIDHAGYVVATFPDSPVEHQTGLFLTEEIEIVMAYGRDLMQVYIFVSTNNGVEDTVRVFTNQLALDAYAVHTLAKRYPQVALTGDLYKDFHLLQKAWIDEPGEEFSWFICDGYGVYETAAAAIETFGEA